MSRLPARLTISALLVVVLLVACSSPSNNVAETSYAPFVANWPGVSREAPRGTLKGDFEWALASVSLSDAALRWEQFLKAHEPPRGEYGDGFHKLHVDAAKLELMRVYYLLGRIDDGDRILKQLDPLAITDGSQPR